ncbi:amidohydrolase family protein [Tindallia californiensis]|uniref:Cytosine/adenosine deaminase n=1 Tax=Tindallia californiensis TaxID=159292 RepID=A0A1H3QRI6_9FIRM|nr:amidohydrolase family protein [Tindallia californiensis]SDZ15628.1 Cytosine/adenosine deaminase [Tindallia californiensis]
MKKVLIRGGYLIDPGNKKEGNYDLLVEGDRISKIEKEITVNKEIEVIEADGKFVVPGFVDLQVNPGNTIEYISDILPFCGITTPLIMPCNTYDGIPIIDHYGGLKKMLSICEGLRVNIATAISIEPPDTGGHETYVKLAVPYEKLSSRIEEFIDLGITSVGEVVLPLGGIAHITSDSSEEFLDRLLEETTKYDMPVLVHTGLGLAGIQKSVEITKGRTMHLCHVGSTCSQDSIHKALTLLEDNPHITTDTHLSEVAGSTSRNSKLVMDYFKRGEVVKIDPQDFKVSVPKDINTAKPPFYYNKTNLLENNIICALSERVEAIETDELGDGIRARIMLKNFFRLVNSVALEHAKIKVLGKLIQKLTVNPARILKINRGTLGEGDFADVVILDLVGEKVDTVLVNGETVVFNGQATEKKPGRRILYKG